MTGGPVLEGDGFVVVGRVTLQGQSNFLVQFDRLEPQLWAPAIYAFRIGGEVVRIGKAEHALICRIEGWRTDVSHALAGEFMKGGTNPWEAFEWRKRLIEHGCGEFLAQQFGPSDTGLLRSRERELIKRYDPPLCNDSATGRRRPPEARSVKDVAKAKVYWQLLNRDAM